MYIHPDVNLATVMKWQPTKTEFIFYGGFKMGKIYCSGKDWYAMCVAFQRRYDDEDVNEDLGAARGPYASREQARNAVTRAVALLILNPEYRAIIWRNCMNSDYYDQKHVRRTKNGWETFYITREGKQRAQA